MLCLTMSECRWLPARGARLMATSAPWNGREMPEWIVSVMGMQPRNFARMLSTDAVHLKGLGSRLR